MKLPNCVKCDSTYIYEANNFYHCPECGHEWHVDEIIESGLTAIDAHGNILRTGDDVIVLKDLRLGGKSDVVKQGTKATNIRIVDGPNNHNIDCRISGFGQIYLKSEFVKKA